MYVAAAITVVLVGALALTASRTLAAWLWRVFARRALNRQDRGSIRTLREVAFGLAAVLCVALVIVVTKETLFSTNADLLSYERRSVSVGSHDNKTHDVRLFLCVPSDPSSELRG